MQAQSLCRKLRRMFPDLKIVLGLWAPTEQLAALDDRPSLECFDVIITQISEMESQFGLKQKTPLDHKSVGERSGTL
jgi:hypothetical protein